jgi:hypothetical protein
LLKATGGSSKEIAAPLTTMADRIMTCPCGTDLKTMGMAFTTFLYRYIYTSLPY